MCNCKCFTSLALICLLPGVLCLRDVWKNVACDEYYDPENCNFTQLLMLDDFDRCGPAELTLNARNYFLGVAGRGLTNKWNKEAYDKIGIVSHILRDVRDNSMVTTVLGYEVDFPIGFSPVAAHKLASQRGEIDTVTGLNDSRTVLIMSSFSTVFLEDVSQAVTREGHPYLWLQTYIFTNRSITVDLVRRAEKRGFKAIVLTVDHSVDGTVTCNAKETLQMPPGIEFVNINLPLSGKNLDVATFSDITWLTRITHLPIVAKGVLSGADAKKVFQAGAKAILVSNHGGRQLDGSPATIDVLQDVVKVGNKFSPPREVYVDGGVRSGTDVYKAIARGARMAFVGRPQIWGLAIAGSNGVRRVIDIIKTNFNKTMLIAGSVSPEEIDSRTLISVPQM